MKGLRDYDDIIRCIQNDKLESLKPIIDGVDMDHIINPYKEYTMLHITALQNRPKIMRFLLESGANPHILDFEDNTPLDYAIMSDHFECIDILLEFNVDVKIGMPLLLCSNVQPPNEPLIKRLLDRGAKLPTNILLSWLFPIIMFRNLCRLNSITFMGMHKMGIFGTISNGKVDKNVIRLIAYHIWSFRLSSDIFRREKLIF